jgi:hypothetical protein
MASTEEPVRVERALLEGGLAAWDGPVEAGEVRRPPVERTPRPWPAARLADADRVDRLRGERTAVVVDARDPARFRGELEPVDPRPGHIPGAVNLPASANVGEDARLLATDELRRRYDLLVLELLRVRGRLYPGSWSAWSADPDRPAATGTCARSDGRFAVLGEADGAERSVARRTQLDRVPDAQGAPFDDAGGEPPVAAHRLVPAGSERLFHA